MADFLKVNRHIGLFYFDSGFRPVPLQQTYIGVKSTNRFEQMAQVDDACYDIVVSNVRQGQQVIVSELDSNYLYYNVTNYLYYNVTNSSTMTSLTPLLWRY